MVEGRIVEDIAAGEAHRGRPRPEARVVSGLLARNETLVAGVILAFCVVARWRTRASCRSRR